MPPRKKPRTGPAPSPHRRTVYNPGKHSLASLPYHILLEVLTYAGTEPGAPSFLLSCATLCRTLHDPAIAALYHTPRLDPPHRAHKLLQTLRERPQLALMVKALRVADVHPLLVRKVAGAHWDVGEFVRLARGLRDVRIDSAALGRRQKWRYTQPFWDALEGGEGEGEAPVRLRSWHWNGDLVANPGGIGAIHKLRSFSALTSLTLQGVHHYYHHYYHQQQQHAGRSAFERELAAIALDMPALRHVKFQDCTVLTATLLGLLAVSCARLELRTLEITACTEVPDTSPDSEGEGEGMGLIEFLQQPVCRSLTTLSVIACHACPLTITAALVALPGLQHFTYEAHTRDAASPPPYATLLPAGDAARIVWPPALRTLAATSLKTWSEAECAAFLASVVDAAPCMGAVSCVEVWAMLADVDWRRRAAFRELWGGRVRAAFPRARVEVRVDNARPAETLWGEEDFVDGGEGVVGGGRRGRGRRLKAKGKGGRADRAVEGDEEYTED